MAASRRAKYVSKGERPNISRSLVLHFRSNTSEGVKLMHKVNSWLMGQNPWVTIENVDGPTNQRHKRVRANSLWGNPKRKTSSAGDDE